MRLSEIIAIADRAYPDGDGVVQAYSENPEVQRGDTLAEFIALELKDVYDADGSSEDQLAEAVRAMLRARDQLDDVVAALENQ